METARSYGLREGHAVRFHNDKEGIKLNYSVMSDTITHVRACKEVQEDWMKEIEEDYKVRNK